MKKINEKTYHEGIKIYFEKIVVKGKKRIRITNAIMSEMDDLPLQYFSEEYFVCEKKGLSGLSDDILFGVNKSSEEIFGKKYLKEDEPVRGYGIKYVFPVRIGSSVSKEDFEKMVQYMKKAGTALNRIMKEVRKTEETWTGYGSVEI